MSKYKIKTEKILKLYKRTDILANGGENMKKERKHVNFQNNFLLQLYLEYLQL